LYCAAIHISIMSLAPLHYSTLLYSALLCPALPCPAAVTVNTDDELIDMPAGKENTSLCTVPMGVLKATDGYLMQLTSLQSELLAVVSGEQLSVRLSACMSGWLAGMLLRLLSYIFIAHS
jgi:hypothetical protein